MIKMGWNIVERGGRIILNIFLNLFNKTAVLVVLLNVIWETVTFAMLEIYFSRLSTVLYFLIAEREQSEPAWKGIISAYFGLSSLQGDSLAASFAPKSAQNSILFRSQNFERADFWIAQGKNAVNTWRIDEYFNAAKTEIRLSKSEFGLLSFGYIDIPSNPTKHPNSPHNIRANQISFLISGVFLPNICSRWNPI